MADFNVNHITGKQGQQGTVLAGVTTVSSTRSMRIPSGPTEQRGGRGRGVFGGGSPSQVNILNFITIATTGNAEDFGDMTIGHQSRASFASATRGIWAGGYTPSGESSRIDYVIISSKGGAVDFGDTLITRQNPMGTSDATRGIYGGSRYSTAAVNNSNLIEFNNQFFIPDNHRPYSGKVIEYFSDGTSVYLEGTYKNGIKDGVWKYYNMSGVMILQKTFNPVGYTYSEFYPHSQLKITGEYIITFP